MSTLNGIWKKIRLYLILVLIPTLIISYFIYDKETEKIDLKNKQTASLMLNIHKNQMNYLISETEARLTSLAMGFDQPLDTERVQTILEKIFKKEPRFSGLYLLDKDGDVTASTTPLKEKINLSHRDYFKRIKVSKQTMITDNYISKITKQRILSICVPVLDKNENVTNVLVAAIQIDYLKNIMNVLNPELHFKILNQHGNVVFTSGPPLVSKDAESVVTYLDENSWKLEVYPQRATTSDVLSVMLFPLSSVFILLNILFTLVQYTILRRQTQLERHQNEAQKLELIGTLAASTAHEIRNPLTGISGFIQLLQKKYHSEEDQLYFSVIEEEIKRINQIVSEFLVLGKPTAEKWQLNSVKEIVGEIMPIVFSEANLYNVEVDLQINTIQDVGVYCTKDHIKQVVLNVAKNSLEAMPNGGKLTIMIEAEKENVVIKVKDTGEGITEEMLKHIFLPFITSKEKGTGLGLVVCKRIISMYGGTIDIDSHLNKGTTVTIMLPSAHSI
ncbi:ATP-binding protein [Bacillus sp. NPDC077027]|uniref:ATP-binding protein n=1 Tax=Bacillus sp. NPDC077027 TaxID=3390548 RepID=UPI003D019D29